MFVVPIDWGLLTDTLMKLGVAYLCALPVGFIAEKEGHAAGIRTFPIVALASCGYMLTLLNIPGSNSIENSSRVLQGLITGIGFVGGGAILKDNFSVHGTATAASIWNTGAIGASVAMGRYEIGIVLALLNVITMRFLIPVKKRIDQ
jgi:putative Mg2+ transporter-C (MgtC) family protein